MTTTINNSDARIDSRDVIDRIAEIVNALDFSNPNEPSETERHLLEGELQSLRNLADQGESLDDWEHGVALIADWDFQNYAQELAEDIGALPKEYSWPTSCIDWEQAAHELRMDYTPLDFAGSTYWAR